MHFQQNESKQSNQLPNLTPLPMIGNDNVANDCCSIRCFLLYKLDYY